MARKTSPLKSLLLVTLLLWLGACASSPATLHSPTPTAASIATRTAAEALARIHNASPKNIPLFASITFTADTTYDQAVAILRRHFYPWTCDEPRSPDPPPLAELHANFAASHGLLMSYPTWDELARIATAPQVVSVEGTALYPCP